MFGFICQVSEDTVSDKQGWSAEDLFYSTSETLTRLWEEACDCTRDLSTDVQGKIILVLIGWLIVNLILIQVAWWVYGRSISDPSLTVLVKKHLNSKAKEEANKKKD